MSAQPPTVTLDSCLDRFLEALYRGERPPLENFLPAGPARLPTLFELAHADLEFRLKRGEEATVDRYLDRFPELRDHPNQVEELRQAERKFRELGPLQPTPAPLLADTLAALEQVQNAPRRFPTIPGYEILGELGRGGMSVVYRAWQHKLNRLVALKMARAGDQASQGELLRLFSEARAIARVQHPNIVQIYEMAQHDGLPFLTLELCNGGSLAQYLKGDPLPVEQVALFMAVVARAVHAAHQRDVIHRDLKPGNILLTRSEGSSVRGESGEQAPDANWEADSVAARSAPLSTLVPKITDFGLAKRIEVTLNITDTHEVMGTPQYMAPEQAQGRSRQVGPAADVYSLGAVLFEMLTGRPPFKGTTAADVVLQVLHDDPPSLYHLNPRAGRDLATVCAVCLAKDPARRYASALELAEDLERVQRGEPTKARPAAVWERALKWGRRHPGFSAACVAAFAVLALLIGGLLWHTQKLQQAYVQADRERDELRRRLEAETHAAQAESGNQSYAADLRVAQQLLRHGDLPRLADILLRHDRPPSLLGKHGFEYEYLAGFRPPARTQWLAHPRGVDVLQATRAGQVLTASAGEVEGGPSLCHVRLWKPGPNAATPLQIYEAQTRSWWPSRPLACVAPAGGRLAYVALDDSLCVVDLAGKPADPRRWRGSNLLSRPIFHPDGSLLACLEGDSRVVLLDAATLAVVSEIRASSVVHLAFSPNGQGLVVVAGGQVIWHPLSDRKLGGAQVFRNFPHDPTALAFSPNGKLLALAVEGTIHVWDLDAGGLRGSWSTAHGRSGHAVDSQVVALAIDPEGDTLSCGCLDGQIVQWDLHRHRILAQWRWHSQAVQTLAYVPDAASPHGAQLAIGYRDGHVILQPTPMPSRFRRPGPSLVCSGPLAWSPDGKLLAVADVHGDVWLLESATGQVHVRLGSHLGGVEQLDFVGDREGLMLVSSHGFDGRVTVWDVEKAKPLRTLPHGAGPLRSLSVGADGRLATVTADGRLRLWRARSGNALRVTEGVALAALAPDGSHLAAVRTDRTLQLWQTDQRIQPLGERSLERGVTALSFTPDSRVVGALLDGEMLSRWQVESNLPPLGKPFSAGVEGDLLGRFEFSPRGDQILALGVIRDWRTYYLDNGRMHWQAVQLNQPVANRWSAARYAPDGNRVALTRTDGTLQIWTLPTFDVLRPAGQAFGAVRSLAFTADGQLLSGHDRPVVEVRTEENNQSLPIFPGRNAVFIQRLREPPTAGLLVWDATLGPRGGGTVPSSPVALATRPAPRDGKARWTIAACSRVATAGNLIAGGSEDGSIWVWQRASGEEAGRLYLSDEVEEYVQTAERLLRLWTSSRPQFPEGVVRVAFSRDGRRLLAMGSKGALRVWRREGTRWLREGEKRLQAGAWAGWLTIDTPQGPREVPAYTHEGHVHFWEAERDGEVRAAVGQPGTNLVCVAASADRRYLAVATNEHLILVWDLAANKQRTLIGHRDAIHDLAFSPSGTLASAGQDGTVRLWNVAAGQEVATLEGHRGPVFAIAFRGDGRTLASAGATPENTGEVLLWDAP